MDFLVWFYHLKESNLIKSTEKKKKMRQKLLLFKFDSLSVTYLFSCQDKLDYGFVLPKAKTSPF